MKPLLLLAFSAASLYAVTPDCQTKFTVTNDPTIGGGSPTVQAPGSSAAFPNVGGTVCTAWTLIYTATGFTQASLQFEESSTAIGPWLNWPGAVNYGQSPFVVTANNKTGYINLTGTYNYVRVTMPFLTGVGTVYVQVYGWVNPANVGSIINYPSNAGINGCVTSGTALQQGTGAGGCADSGLAPATVATAVTQAGTALQPAAIGTSGAKIPLLNGNNTHSGTNLVTGSLHPSGSGVNGTNYIENQITVDVLGTVNNVPGPYSWIYPNGTGRTQTSKNQDVISAMDFGCDPSGLLDSQPCVQAAVNQAQLASAGIPKGKCLYVPAGRYKLLTPVTYVSGSLCIQGENGLNIISGAIGQFDTTTFVLTTAGFIPATPLFTGAATALTFRDLAFAGGTNPIDLGQNGLTDVERISGVDFSGYLVQHLQGEHHNWKQIYCWHETVNAQGCLSFGEPKNSPNAAIYAYSTPASITAVSVNSNNVATVTASNGFGGAGQSITITGLSATTCLANGTYGATATNSTTFTFPFTHANCSASVTGTATPNPVTDGLFDRATINDVEDLCNPNISDQYTVYAANGNSSNLSFSNTHMSHILSHGCTGQIDTFRFFNVQQSHFVNMLTDTLGLSASPVGAVFDVEGFFNYSEINGFYPGLLVGVNAFYANAILAKGAWTGSRVSQCALSGNNTSTYGIRIIQTSGNYGSVEECSGSLFYFTYTSSAAITNVAATSGTWTLTATNSFSAGQNVDLTGLTTATQLNGLTVTVLAGGLSGSQFSFTYGTSSYTSAADIGTAKNIASLTNPLYTNRLLVAGGNISPTNATGATVATDTNGTGITSLLMNDGTGTAAASGNFQILAATGVSGQSRTILTENLNGLGVRSNDVTINGSVGGSCIVTQPLNGVRLKRVIAECAAFNGTGTATYTYPVAFGFTPFMSGTSTITTGSTATTTALTLVTAGAITGWLFLDGF